MIALRDLVRYCDQLLESSRFRDAATNGVQVEGRTAVRRLAVAVSANRATIERAVAWDADVLLVHHGLFWGDGLRSLTGIVRERLRPLLVHEVSLIAYHLPLDAHPELGNNAQLAFALGLEPAEPFAQVAGQPIGWVARANEPRSLDELVAAVQQCTGRPPIVLSGGPPVVRQVAILSGSGASALEEAAALGCEAFLTGEARETTMALARELGVTVIVGGHEATERLGVQALARHLSSAFGLEITFLHDPNPL
ncbi:Nif3-like dinuclear metal center hexameric protein [Thermomicrobium sp. 4228-Ro]|uniref:Nif3-like dinuclear metal center hexameric protein n=1 Tax=Thermomicrobium sp. 4228-Ro TaxID=2993937 RepID=UPI0022494906|nr:Nif3-like dinuclear metal center hexameric protein [Thermomicrobium sp. 4228-Ro]MCX2727552.1 Nif3-like dinuclear metal center hexameric protein [Thermomicrobium sp. 4228-Ro]